MFLAPPNGNAPGRHTLPFSLILFIFHDTPESTFSPYQSPRSLFPSSLRETICHSVAILTPNVGVSFSEVTLRPFLFTVTPHAGDPTSIAHFFEYGPDSFYVVAESPRAQRNGKNVALSRPFLFCWVLSTKMTFHPPHVPRLGLSAGSHIALPTVSQIEEKSKTRRTSSHHFGAGALLPVAAGDR